MSEHASGQHTHTHTHTHIPVALPPRSSQMVAGNTWYSHPNTWLERLPSVQVDMKEMHQQVRTNVSDRYSIPLV